MMLLGSFNGYLYKAIYWLTAMTCFAFLVVVLGGVLSRYVTQTPILGSVEMSRLFFIWSCFLAAALCYYQRAHISITFLMDRLPPVLFRWVQVLVHVSTLAFFVTIGYQSIQVGVILSPTDFPMLGFSQSWLYWPVPVAMLLMIFFNIEFLLQAILKSPKALKHDVVDTSD